MFGNTESDCQSGMVLRLGYSAISHHRQEEPDKIAKLWGNEKMMQSQLSFCKELLRLLFGISEVG